MDRQKILTRENPVRLDVVLDEAVLRHPLGTPKQFREQLLHLLKFNVQIVPMNNGYHPGWTGMQIILQFDGQPTLLWREARGIGTIADAEAEVEEAWETWEDILSAALPLDKSREMIRAIADEFSEDE